MGVPLSGVGPPKRMTEGIPDLKWINRSLPIADVARRLGVRFGQPGMVHCWHPDKHEHGDRTPSRSIRPKNNTTKCFGCGTKPLSVADLVMDVLGLSLK